MRRVQILAVGVGFVLSVTNGLAEAEKVRLKDGTEFAAQVLGRDAEHVTLAVARGQVDTVDGTPLPAPVTTGTQAPAFSALDLSGATQTVPVPASVVTLVQFWATWCPHCRSDLALLKTLSARYQAQGFRIVTVSVDKDLTALRRFVQEQKLPYPVIAAYEQPPSAQSSLPELYEMEGIPAYYVIDAQGIIAQTASGSFTESGTDVEGTLKRLLGKPAA